MRGNRLARYSGFSYCGGGRRWSRASPGQRPPRHRTLPRISVAWAKRAGPVGRRPPWGRLRPRSRKLSPRAAPVDSTRWTARVTWRIPSATIALPWDRVCHGPPRSWPAACGARKSETGASVRRSAWARPQIRVSCAAAGGATSFSGRLPRDWFTGRGYAGAAPSAANRPGARIRPPQRTSSELHPNFTGPSRQFRPSFALRSWTDSIVGDGPGRIPRDL